MLGLCPGDGRAVSVLHMRSASVAYDIGAAGNIIKHPINESGTVQAVRTYRSGAGAASGPDLFGGSPLFLLYIILRAYPQIRSTQLACIFYVILR